jgi:hypothetical protein
MKIEIIETDQDWKNETTTTWFRLNGEDFKTGVLFDNEIVGVVQNNGETTIVNADNIPLTDGDRIVIAVRNTINID